MSAAIHLGLERITRLVRTSRQPWDAIHVAGTNGKGSICAYLSAMLKCGGVRCGRFTSPHLIDRWDCITVDEKPVTESVFRDVESRVKARDKHGGIQASPFELLTATAFEVFTEENVDVAVIECGMGGRRDATNVLHRPRVSVISKIGLDHVGTLGSTLEEIALEKAGIFKPGVPIVVDGTSDPSVLAVLADHAQSIAAGPLHRCKDDLQVLSALGWNKVSHDHANARIRAQSTNISVAFHALKTYWSLPDRTANVKDALTTLMLQPAVRNTVLPGRLQQLDIAPLIPERETPILLDGAHNEQSAEKLSSFVNPPTSAPRKHRVTWLLALSKGKDARAILAHLLRPGDAVIAVEFGPVDGMPWVSPMPCEELVAMAEEAGVAKPVSAGRDVLAALKEAVALAGSKKTEGDNAGNANSRGGETEAEVESTEVGHGEQEIEKRQDEVVVAGSLYLISDVLRLLREARRSAGEDVSTFLVSDIQRSGKTPNIYIDHANGVRYDH